MIGAPLIKFFRKYFGKSASAGITLGIFVLLSVFFVSIFVPPLVTQVKNLSGIDYQKVISSVEQPLSDWENYLIEKKLINPRDSVQITKEQNGEDNYVFDQKLVIDSLINPYDSTVVKNINLYVKIDAKDLNHHDLEDPNPLNVDFFEKLKSNIGYYINPKRIQEIFSSTISAFGNLIVGIASIFFIAFFFLREQGLFFNMISAAIPDEYEDKVSHAIEDTSKLLIRYFSGVLMQMFVITLFVSIALTILGIQNALLIGFFAAVMNVIPYIGPIIGAGFAVIITISSNLDVDFYAIILPQLTKVIIVFAFMQMLDNFLLQPTIFSKSVKAHPLEIFLVVLVGAKIGGVLGMVLAIPLYTVLRVVGKVFLSEFKVIKVLTKDL
jgi:predicted PurR-regulated permease PerM